MGKHRKKQYYRRIAIAVAAVGAVGIPSVALACGDWPGGTSDQAGSQLTDRDSGAAWWAQAALSRQSNVSASTVPTAMSSATVPVPPAVPAPPGAPVLTVPAAPQTPSAAASAPHAAVPHATAPKAKAAAPAHKRHTSASHPEAKPRPSVSPSAPKPAATATAAPAPAAPAASATSAAPSATPSATAAAPSSPTAQAPAAGDVAQVVQLVNTERAKVGCSPLTVNASLTEAAQAHSEDMAAHQNMSHAGSDGSAPGDRITAAGYVWSSYGENVAYGYATPEQVMAGWMASPGHKANILNCSFKEIGIGLAQPGSYWTQDFGTAR
ncbi:CAP domain-containing protein [Streptomyces sp. NPDC093260]|uniref:CAP domain-containing protein n=1 Tax=Streptomyces sp. NPDC093260 TaxID=3155073 RepID=UPI00343CB67D